MGHRKWSQEKGCGLFSAEVNEHNALYDAWEVERDRANDLLNDRNAIQEELDEARKHITELESPLRVPFSDDVIERMAQAAQETMWRCGTTWPDCIRAALAAGGLEPCAVPDYDPDDVALTPIERVLRKRLADVDAKVERQRKNLNQLYTANADLRDQLAAADLDLADKAFYVREFAAVSAELDAMKAELAAIIDPPADQVEALARVLREAYAKHDGDVPEVYPILGFRIEARAAIAHLATRPEGIPTAEDIKYLPGKPHVFNNELLIAAYKALKTRHALEWDDETNKDGWQRVLDVVRNATYETLRPWLRDPVGFELDVTADEIVKAIVHDHRDTLKIAQAVLDLCRSRIRPTYECDCSAIEKERDLLKVEYESRQIMINNVRAALEGRPFKNTLEGE